MPKPNEPQEVAVLRFFEEGPIERAELLFNIIAAKMQARRQSKAPNGIDPLAKARKPRNPQRPEVVAMNPNSHEMATDVKD